MKKFDRNVPFNDLSDLPPSDDMFDKDILFKWGIASRALAELNRNIMRMPNPTMLVNTITLQEAQTSTAIFRYKTSRKYYLINHHWSLAQ